MRSTEEPGAPSDSSARGLRVLVVDDSLLMRQLLADAVQASGVRIEFLADAADGALALRLLAQVPVDVVLTDVHMPNTDGPQLITQIVRRPELAKTRIIVLGPIGSCSSPGFAHDCRRARGAAGPRPVRFEVGELSVDTGTMTAMLTGERLRLTTFEFAVLRALAERAGRVLTREQLLQLVHAAGDEAFDRSIDVHVSRLRAKLHDDSRHPKLLKTIRGVGYVLCLPDTL